MIKKYLINLLRILGAGFAMFAAVFCVSMIVQALLQGYFTGIHMIILLVGLVLAGILLWISRPSIWGDSIENITKQNIHAKEVNKNIEILCIGMVCIGMALATNITFLDAETIQAANAYITNVTQYDAQFLQTVPPIVRDIPYAICAILATEDVVSQYPGAISEYMRIEGVLATTMDLFYIRVIHNFLFILLGGSSITRLMLQFRLKKAERIRERGTK